MASRGGIDLISKSEMTSARGEASDAVSRRRAADGVVRFPDNFLSGGVRISSGLRL